MHQLRRYFIKFDKVATSANTVQWSMQLLCLTLWSGVTWSEKQTQTQQVLFDNLHTVYWGWFRLKYLLSLQKKQIRKLNKRGSSQIPQPLWATLTKILKFQEARQMLQSNKKKKKVAYKKVSLHMWGEKACKRKRGRERENGVRWDGMRGREGRMLCRWFIKN